MTRVLFWLLLAFLVLYVLRNKKGAARKQGGPRQAGPHGAAPQASAASPATAERMVRCALCEVYLPESEALHDAAGTVFCSEEHRLQHARR